MKTAKEVHADLFSRRRNPRSSAYKAGCLAGLKFVMQGVPSELPYLLGTADADAWFAGLVEGKNVGREHLYVTDPSTDSESA